MTEQDIMFRFAHEMALKDSEIAVLKETIEHLKGQIKILVGQ